MRALIMGLVLISGVVFSPVKAAIKPVAAAQLSQLAKDPVWLTLLHFEENRSGVQHSAIVSESFFISPRGHVSALAELESTLEAFFSEASSGEMQCRYPARLQWLQSKVPALEGFELAKCSDYEEWAGDATVESVSIVFAAGHLKSPASYFGHNFLKFNSAASSNSLLDQSINYGAEIPPEHGPLPYLYNGIFGGYRAAYETQQFARQLASYGEQNLRDLWEYELDLTGDEVDFLLLHAWELNNQKLSYYFFRENCAYHIARLLGLVTTELFVPQYMPWTMPYNVMSRLAEVERNGEPLVKNINYHPSRRSRFRRGFSSLSAKQKEQIRLVIDSDFPDMPLQLEEESNESNSEVIDTLLDYYELRAKEDSDDAVAKEARRQLLLKRLISAPSADSRKIIKSPKPPHLASKPGFVATSYLSNSKIGPALELSMRPGYFEYLSDNIGRNNIGNFTLLDTRMRYQDERIRLYRLNIADIANLLPSSTGITGDSAKSWRFRVGFDQTNNACESCLRPMLDWQIGSAWGIAGDLSFFALTGIRVQGEHDRDNALVSKTTFGVTGRLSSNIKVFATAGRHEDIGSRGLDRNPVNVQFRFHKSSRWDFRLHYLRDVAEEFQITLGRYW